jgi:ABC-2 type transport system ATP-binding protein
MQCIIEAKNLKKSYGKVPAVRDVSLALRPGECFGLLGPNGAGKTTSIEILEGTLEADAGVVLFRGKPRAADPVAFRLAAGIQFQKTSLQDHMRVGEALTMFASFYPGKIDTSYVIAQCQLQDILDRDVNKLSGGQRQRVLIAIALVNDPDLIFLDEPTTGLDPQARRAFWNLILDIKSRGKTILLTTHYMEEASVLCDRIAIMDHGKIITEGNPAALLQGFGAGATLDDLFLHMTGQELR